MTAGSLRGVRVVVTRPRARSRRLVDLLRAADADVIELPVIEIADPPSWKPVDDAVEGLATGRYDWVAFTSANGVERFFSRISDVAAVKAKVAAVGGKTAAALERRGIAVDLVPDRSTGPDLADALGAGRGRLLLARVEDAPGKIVEILNANGWRVDEVAAYRSVRTPTDSAEAERVRSGDFDVVTFASGSAVRAFVERVAPPSDLGLSVDERSHRIVVCIGPVTAAAARRVGVRVDVVPPDATDEGLASALVESLSQPDRA